MVFPFIVTCVFHFQHFFQCAQQMVSLCTVCSSLSDFCHCLCKFSCSFHPSLCSADLMASPSPPVCPHRDILYPMVSLSASLSAFCHCALYDPLCKSTCRCSFHPWLFIATLMYICTVHHNRHMYNMYYTYLSAVALHGLMGLGNLSYIRCVMILLIFTVCCELGR